MDALFDRLRRSARAGCMTREWRGSRAAAAKPVLSKVEWILGLVYRDTPHLNAEIEETRSSCAWAWHPDLERNWVPPSNLL